MKKNKSGVKGMMIGAAAGTAIGATVGLMMSMSGRTNAMKFGRNAIKRVGTFMSGLVGM